MILNFGNKLVEIRYGQDTRNPIKSHIQFDLFSSLKKKKGKIGQEVEKVTQRISHLRRSQIWYAYIKYVLSSYTTRS